jgi:apolipoprotein N-acyltransferase
MTAWLPRLALCGHVLPIWAGVLLLAVAGASAPWAFAPTEAFWWLPVALLPLFRAFAKASARQAMFAAFLWAWPYFLVGVGWLSVALARYGGLPWPAAWAAVALFAAYLAAWWALAAGLAVRWSPSGSAFRRALFTAALFTLAEWTRGWAFTGFPWLSPGLSQTPPSPLAGFYPLVGALGVGFLLFALAGIIASDVSWRRWLPLVALVAALGGALRGVEWSRPVGAPLALSLVQPAIPQDQKWDGALLGRHLWRQAELIAQTRGTLVVLPETSLPLLDVQIPDEWRHLVAQTLGEDRTLLYGVFTRDEAGQSRALFLSQTPPRSVRRVFAAALRLVFPRLVDSDVEPRTGGSPSAFLARGRDGCRRRHLLRERVCRPHRRRRARRCHLAPQPLQPRMVRP